MVDKKNPKMRYFKTPYTTKTQGKFLLHNNDLGNDPNIKFIEKYIQDINKEEVLINHWVEISCEEYFRLETELENA